MQTNLDLLLQFDSINFPNFKLYDRWKMLTILLDYLNSALFRVQGMAHTQSEIPKIQKKLINLKSLITK